LTFLPYRKKGKDGNGWLKGTEECLLHASLKVKELNVHFYT
jgi:hypothetical protein